MSEPLIIGSVALAVIDTTVGDLIDSNQRGPSFKVVIGGFIVTIVLLVVSEANEEVADGLAVVLLLATLFGPKGGALSTVIGKVTGLPNPQGIGEAAIATAQQAAVQTANQPKPNPHIS